MAERAKTVLVPVANGSEEIETVCILDTLRRAGAIVTLASVEQALQVTCSRGVKLVADQLIADVPQDEAFDVVALPGGMPGAEHLRDSEPLVRILRNQKQQGRWYAALCASPAVVFQHHGLFEGVKAMTSHPNFVKDLPSKESAECRVVVDGKCITSRAPGTSIEFALKIVEVLYGKEKADAVAAPMLVLLPQK